VPFAYLLLKAWTSVLGESEWALRSLSLAAYGGAVLVTGLAGRLAGGPAVAIVSALLMATSTRLGLAHAATARPYALLCLLAASAVLASIALLRVPGHAPTRAAILAGALALLHLAGLWTHPIYAFLLAAVALGTFAAGRERRWLGFAAAAIAVAVYVVTWGGVLRETMAIPATAWMPAPEFQHLIDSYTVLWGNRNAFILFGALVTLVALAPGRAAALVATPVARFVIIAGLVAVLLPFAISYARPVFLSGRTPMLALPLAALGAALVLSRLGTTTVLVALSALCLQGSVQGVVASYRSGDPAPTRESVAHVVAHARCGDTLVMTGLSYSAVEYYLRRLEAPGCLARETFPADVRSHPGWIDTARIAAESEQLARQAAERATRVTPGERVWLFGWDRGIGRDASLAARKGFDAELLLIEHLELEGAFFRWIRLYGDPGGSPRP
jgi:mannosyltransferase